MNAYRKEPVLIGYASHPGRKKINQDALLILTAQYGTTEPARHKRKREGRSPIGRIFHSQPREVTFAAVCDGMGGHDCGEKASRIAVSGLEKWFNEQLPRMIVAKGEPSGESRRKMIAESMKKAFAGINDELMAEADSGKRMGSTAAALLLTEDYYIAVHIGDTRIYDFSEDPPLLTQDHSWVMEEVRAGRLRPEDRKTDPRRNILVRCLGVSGEAEPDIKVGERRDNAVFLICSDGFWRESEEKLASGGIQDDSEADFPGLPETEQELTARLSLIMDSNLSLGETDNMTAVVIQSAGNGIGHNRKGEKTA